MDKKTLEWCAQQCHKEADLMDRLGVTYMKASPLEIAQMRRVWSLRCIAETIVAKASKTPEAPKEIPRCNRGAWVMVGASLTIAAVLLATKI